jgi:tetratricopeptide (TPR) repeat protein
LGILLPKAKTAIMKVSMPKGSAHGWGVAGTYLANEVAKLPALEGVTLHCISGHDFSPFNRSDWGQINIGYCFFEHEILAYHHIPSAAKRWDHIVAGSHWCEYHLRIGGMDRASTIIQGVDQNIFSRQQLRADDGRFIVFSGGKFEFRKGQDIVIAAMRRFMEKHPDAWLACAWHNQWPHSIRTMEQSPLIDFNYHDNSPEALYLETLSRNGIDPTRVILYPVVNNNAMSRIYAESDIGFFPNRCEGGNNMVMCEYMACGRTVIASNRTGQADVISPDNAFCLENYKPVLVGTDPHKTGVWFEASVDEAVDLLEQAYRQKDVCAGKAFKAARDMQKLSWQESARQFHAIAAHYAPEPGNTIKPSPTKPGREEIELLFAEGNFTGAERCCRDLLCHAPFDAELYNCLATALDSQGRHLEAVAHYHKAISLDPHLSIAGYNLANSLRRLGDDSGASAILRQVTAENPEFLEAWHSLAMIYISQDAFADAALCFEKVVALEPSDMETRCALGTMYSETGRFNDAIACFESVLATQPEHLRALESLGSAFHELDQLDRAEECFRRVLAKEPENISVLNNLGTVLRSKAKPNEAIDIFNLALSLEPENGQIRLNRAVARLALGDLPAAWEEYEARFDARVPTRLYHSYLPRWNGEPLDGRGLLVQSEQGFGDTFQFIRYLRLLNDAGGPVVFECQNESVRKALTGIDYSLIITRGEPLPPVTAQIPLVSLPKLFGTSLATIPFASGYLSVPSQQKLKWNERLAADHGKLRVGIVWGGNKYSLNANRSIKLRDLGPLFTIPDIRYYSLQVGSDAEQLSDFSGNLIDMGSKLNDFGDSAAIIGNLDLIITIDTAIAHLAGALGGPTWVLLKYAPDWRWFLNRFDSPWYSSVRLFRQQSPGDWDSVVPSVVTELMLFRDKKKLKFSSGAPIG